MCCSYLRACNPKRLLLSAEAFLTCWEARFMQKPPKVFFTYEKQIEHLKSKKLIIPDETAAIEALKRYSYYSCISAYKGIFKSEPNGDYLEGTTFSHVVALYLLDRHLRDVFFHSILIVENHLKSLYSYSFCEIIGDKQEDYFNVNNYNYARFQQPTNELIAHLQAHLTEPLREYISYNLQTYGEVPLWVLIHSLTLGNVSKMYEISLQKLQSAVAKGFGSKDVYPFNLVSMLKVLSKFRNTCAHNERLYSYRTQTAIEDMPVHSALGIGHHGKMYKYGKNDLFSVVICLKYLLSTDDFNIFFIELKNVLEEGLKNFDSGTAAKIQKAMGFPCNWEDIYTL